MLDETFYIDGVDVRKFGVYLQHPVSISGVVPIFEEIEIPGKNGTLTHYTGAYENRKGSAECFALDGKNVQNNVSAFSNFLFSKKGYRKLQTSEDEQHYYLARIENGADVDDRLKKLNPFEIEFSCMPQKFVISGEKNINFSKKVEENLLYNPYGNETKPLIKLIGFGDGSVTINGVEISVFDINEALNIDCETENAFGENGENLNHKISVEKFPALLPGENSIKFDGGLILVSIVPRWWEL